jgi:protein-L-isoaspartate(D-aspartate) O-methyltransferase
LIRVCRGGVSVAFFDVAGPKRVDYNVAMSKSRIYTGTGRRPRLQVLVVAAALLIAPAFLSAPAYAQNGNAKAENMEKKRLKMVDEQIRNRGVKDSRVLAAMESVPRHEFVPKSLVNQAYSDHPLFIGGGQTISQPYIVALMTEILELEPGDRVLEIGTGSGYQAAVLSELVDSVFTIEIIDDLGLTAAERLKKLGYDNVYVRIGDGYKGWPEKAPFDAVIVTAAPDAVPPALVDQLAEGGRMVLPVGTGIQELVLIEKKGGKIVQRDITSVRFVPMVHGDPKETGDR